jgi:hypothetical protein
MKSRIVVVVIVAATVTALNFSSLALVRLSLMLCRVLAAASASTRAPVRLTIPSRNVARALAIRQNPEAPTQQKYHQLPCKQTCRQTSYSSNHHTNSNTLSIYDVLTIAIT